MSDYKKSFNRRALVVYFMALAFGIGCVMQVLYLAFWQRPLFSGDPEYCLDKTQPDWEKNPLARNPNCRCIVTMNDITPVRGDILDDQGNILASDFTVFDVVIDGRKLHIDTLRNKKWAIVSINDTLYATPDRKISRSDKEAVNKLITELADQLYYHFKNKFPYSKEYYRKKLAEAILEYKNVDILKSNLLSEKTLVTHEDTAFIRKLPLFQDRCKKKCIGFPGYFKRIYPYGELAKRIIGTVPPGARSGLELTFNDWLSGRNGAQKVLYIDGIRVPSEKFSNPQDGASVHTTLNLRMQNIVYEALMDKLYLMGAQWGCAVIMEVNTGEIKAIANLKRHANENGKVGYYEIFNHAFRQECEPGSTFKLASLLTYLEKVPDDTAKAYMLCGCDIAKYFAGDSKKFKTKCGVADAGLGSRHRRGKPIEIFQRSLNEGTGTMIFDAYNNNFQSYLKALDSIGITMPLETQLGTVGAPRIIRDAKSMRTFYITTWGGFNMAPIQTLTYFNGVANNGKMLCPKIVSCITQQDKVVEVYPTVVLKEQMTRKDVIDRAKKYLEAVVSGPYGTARTYKDSIPHFAGKTGTRDILVELSDGKWGYDPRRNSISFCGYFPVEKPKYTMIVYLYDVNGMSGSAVQLFYTIAKRITSLETTDLLQEIDKSGGMKNEIYMNLGR
ncbi:MAG: penicillin-binding transpeptidase domain-containing protein [Bacteroidetes bacterium]|nr:penicillin-binding transpeptidase domain-containing protein [Bacteroidota bacterium]MCL1968006.1 penicillin-binding transpeptidase domain-containing protein [Bacteroidota bacterium]